MNDFKAELKQYSHIFQLIKIPVYAILTFLFFRNFKLSFAEHIIVNSYIVGYLTVLFIFSFPFLFISYKVFFFISSAGFFYSCYAYMDVFEEKRFTGLLKAIVVLITVMFFDFLILDTFSKFMFDFSAFNEEFGY